MLCIFRWLSLRAGYPEVTSSGLGLLKSTGRAIRVNQEIVHNYHYFCKGTESGNAGPESRVSAICKLSFHLDFTSSDSGTGRLRRPFSKTVGNVGMEPF